MNTHSLQQWLDAGYGQVMVTKVIDSTAKDEASRHTHWTIISVGRPFTIVVPKADWSSVEAHAVAMEFAASMAYRLTEDGKPDTFAMHHASSCFTRLLRFVATGLNRTMASSVAGWKNIDHSKYGWTNQIFEIIPLLEIVYDSIKATTLTIQATKKIHEIIKDIHSSLDKLGYKISVPTVAPTI
jgi:hypothetical protein